MNYNLKVHQKIRLEILEGQYEGNHYCRIEEIVDNGIILVTIPAVTSSLTAPVNVGETIKVYYWDIMAQYAFEARVIDIQIGVTASMVTLEKCSEIQKIQQRAYFRIPAELRVVYCIEREGEESNEPRQLEGQTLNISGSGMWLATNTKLELGDKLLLKLYLSVHEYISIFGLVVRLEFLESKDLSRAGIFYSIIKESDRDKIIAYIQKKEIEMRKKGLL